ncbi:phospholipid-metabolizing enzyme A-C1-like [Acanthaster planci]|uniref:Phospholipid-metabolizing enzyme A-C1-like n=1 Tax=Acanthaster planci TaxID=133434 RepID=A0A8B7ZZB9_ACAPL|nr:phospholipid-metabolizing enzyme A-C1-like [Acanthaster planci]
MASNNHFGMVGRWYEPNSQDLNALEKTVLQGDRLEFSRDDLYSHWGIYVGRYRGIEHAVIHFGMFEGGAAFSKKKTSGSAVSARTKPKVRADSIREVLGTSGKVRINNSKDKEKDPLSVAVIVDSATEMHREQVEIDYDLFESNCEHFVNFCRYDHAVSDQADAAKDVVAIGVAGLAVGAIAGVAVALTKALKQ